MDRNAHWESLLKKEGLHYNIFQSRYRDLVEMEALKEVFSDGKADEMNFCLFSTSGVHGMYTTIEEVESSLQVAPCNRKRDEYYPEEVTFVIIHPRVVCIRYANVKVRSMEDVDFLKALRQSSWDAVLNIGKNQ